MTCPCPCACHGGPYATCSVDGGCGSLPGGCPTIARRTRTRPRRSRPEPDHTTAAALSAPPDMPAEPTPDLDAPDQADELAVEQLADEVLDHRCARGPHCDERVIERDDQQQPTGRRLGAQIPAIHGLCDACTRAVTHAIRHLPGDVVELTTLLGNSSSTAEVFVDGSRDLPVPIRLGVEALRTEIDDELQAWVEPVAEHLGIDWDTLAARRSRVAVRAKRAADTLAARVDVLLALPEQEHPAWADGEPVWDPAFHPDRVQDTVVRDGIAGGLALLELHRRAYAAAGRTELVHRLPVPCPWCDHMTLVRRNGAAEVTCERSGCRGAAGIPEKHYSWFVKVTVEEEQRRMAEQSEAAA